MSDASTLFEDALETLGFSRGLTVAEVENIPEDRWGWRPHENAKSVGELVHHIVVSTATLVGEAADAEGDFTRRPHEEHVRAHAADVPEDPSPAELKAALERTHAEAVAKIRAAGPDHMGTDITRFDGGTWKRLTYVFYASGHEDYHRGQLATYARSMGLVPALTRRIHGDAAK